MGLAARGARRASASLPHVVALMASELAPLAPLTAVEAVEAWWIPSPRRGLDRRACKQATRRASLDGSRYYTSGC